MFQSRFPQHIISFLETTACKSDLVSMRTNGPEKVLIRKSGFHWEMFEYKRCLNSVDPDFHSILLATSNKSPEVCLTANF